MKKRKKATGKRALGLLFILIIGTVGAYYTFQQTKQIKRRKAEAAISFTPNFNPLPADFARRHRETIHERYQGLDNEKTDLRFNAETPVHVPNISKTTPAIAVLRLDDQHKIQ